MENCGRRGLTGAHNTKARDAEPPLHLHSGCRLSTVRHHQPAATIHPLASPSRSQRSAPPRWSSASASVSTRPSLLPRRRRRRFSRRPRCSPRPAAFGRVRIASAFSTIGHRFFVYSGAWLRQNAGPRATIGVQILASSDRIVHRCCLR